MHTMRSKLLIGITSLMLITIALVVFFVWNSTKDTLHRQQESEAQNLLVFTHLLVETEHQSILYHEKEMLRTRKDELRDVLDTAFSSLEILYNKSRNGIISEKTAQKQALEYLENIRYDSGIGYIWVNDTLRPIPRMVMHPEIPSLNGKILDDPTYNCAFGTDLNLFSAFRNVCENEGEGFVEYMWPKPLPDGSIGDEQPKLSYVRMFQPWQWVVGTGLYIDDIQASADNRLEVVKNELQEALMRLRINSSGYVFIFNGNQEFITHPLLNSQNEINIENPDTGTLILGDLIQASKNGENKLEYHWNRPGYDQNRFIYPKIAYLTHFEPLDWYIAASYYIDDVQRPAVELRSRILLISSLVLLIAIWGAFLLSKHITRPLKQLASDANRIRREGMIGQSIIESGPTETVELGHVLNEMLTSLQATETSLLESREDLRITLNSIGDAVIATDEHSNVTRMNPEAEKITGWQFENAKGKPIGNILILMDQHTRESLKSPSDVVLAKREITSFTEPVILSAKDGRECIIADSAAPIINPDGNLIGAVIVFRDITDQLEAEKQLHQRQKMDSIGQLAGGIAHDFNNMLAGILGFAELLGMEVKNRPDLHKMADGISKSAVRASELVGKLLAFARENPAIYEEFDFHECLDDALVLLQRSLDRSIELKIDKRATLSYIKGDVAEIENVILNLGINARDAMPNGGTLTFETENVFLDPVFCNASQFSIESGEYLLVKCTDTGTGIPAKLLDSIFEPYFTTKEVGKGSGLGLAAVFGTIHAHQGEISVYSEVGHGTTFHCYLPVTESEQKKSSSKSLDQVYYGEGGILVIDDEVLVRRMAHSVLTTLGYSVYLATDGLEGVKLYKEVKDKVEVVILDMIMPNMAGEVCFHELRKINPEAKIIVSSGFAQNEAIDRLLNDGAVGYIKKPYTLRSISKLLHEVLTEEGSAD